MIIESKIFFPPKFSKTVKSLIVLALLLIYFLVTVLLLKNAVLFLVAIPVAFFLDYFGHSRSDPEKYLNGSIDFTDDYININGSHYLLKDINNLTIEINEYDWEVRAGSRGSYTLNGTDNSLIIKNNTENINIKFYISNQATLTSFKELFKVWYNKKFNFIEQNKAGRTYFLEHLNYQQIQEFKNKYGV